MKASSAFVFSKVNRERIAQAYKKYPDDRKQSAVMEIMWIAQEQNNGWLSIPAIEAVAEELHMPAIRVLELATFYSMFQTKPVGTFHIQCCQTLPCKLRGGAKVVEALEHKLNIRVGETTPDGRFSLSVVECLGCCANAPVMQINRENYEDLNEQAALGIVDALEKGAYPRTGSQSERKGSQPWSASVPKTPVDGKQGHARKRK